MTPEKEVQNKIVNYLHKLGIYVERRNAGGFSYKKGIADLYAVVKGYHVEIEVKRPGGFQSPMQELWQKECEQKYGIIYICADSLEDFKNLLTKIQEAIK